MKYILIFTICVLSVANGFGQNVSYRHQVGINASSFVPLFKGQPSNYLLNYRFILDSSIALRTAANYSQTTGDTKQDRAVDMGLKLGIDKSIRSFKKFHIYTGFDFLFLQDRRDYDDRSTTKFGGAVFLGIRYQISNHFSISSEPGFYWYRTIAKDPNNFDPDRHLNKWHEFTLDNVGQLLISVHF